MAQQEDKRSIRRQVERIFYDILMDTESITNNGSFCQLSTGPFSRANGWRNWQVRRALVELNNIGHIKGLQLDYGRASFHLLPPPNLRYLLEAHI